MPLALPVAESCDVSPGVAVIAVDAGNSLLLQRSELIETANRLGVSVVGLRLSDG